MTCHKNKYDTQEEATKDAQFLNKSNKHRTGNRYSKCKLKSYLCPACGKWHLSNMPKNKAKRIQKSIQKRKAKQ